MNFLNIKKGPPMDFIAGEHRNEFERHVIDIYCNQEGGFWGCVPSADIMMNDVGAKFIFAGIMNKGTEDPHYYHKETHGKIVPEFEPYWAMANLRSLEQSHPGNVTDGYARTYLDMKSVLDYHNMFHMFLINVESLFKDYKNGTGDQGVCNVPLHRVW